MSRGELEVRRHGLVNARPGRCTPWSPFPAKPEGRAASPTCCQLLRARAPSFPHPVACPLHLFILSPRQVLSHPTLTDGPSTADLALVSVPNSATPRSEPLRPSDVTWLKACLPLSPRLTGSSRATHHPSCPSAPAWRGLSELRRRKLLSAHTPDAHPQGPV